METWGVFYYPKEKSLEFAYADIKGLLFLTDVLPVVMLEELLSVVICLASTTTGAL